MPEPSFYLFPNHQNFQPGKSRLEKAAVFETNNIWLGLGIMAFLFFLWSTGHFFRLSQSEISTTAKIISCELRYGAGSTQFEYEYFFEGRRYDGLAYVERGQFPQMDCSDEGIRIYYFPMSPENATFSPSAYSSLYGFISFVLSLIGLAFLVFVYHSFLRNRRELYKYAKLQQADTILSAEIIRIAAIEGRYAHQLAKYRFYGQDGKAIVGQIDSNQKFIWPSQIQVGDTLAILYVDDETYCVL